MKELLPQVGLSPLCFYFEIIIRFNSTSISFFFVTSYVSFSSLFQLALAQKTAQTAFVFSALSLMENQSTEKCGSNARCAIYGPMNFAQMLTVTASFVTFVCKKSSFFFKSVRTSFCNNQIAYFHKNRTFSTMGVITPRRNTSVVAKQIQKF